jgi:hypothetical protein
MGTMKYRFFIVRAGNRKRGSGLGHAPHCLILMEIAKADEALLASQNRLDTQQESGQFWAILMGIK